MSESNWSRTAWMERIGGQAKAMSETIPEDVMKAAREIVAVTYDNGDYAEAARMVRDGNGDGMISVQVAARAILQEREKWKPAVVYFERYCRDEAAELDACISEQHHEDAKAFAAATRAKP